MAIANSTSTERLFAAVRDAQEPSLRLADAGEQARAKARLLQAIDTADRSQQRAVQPTPRRRPWALGIGTFAAAACAFALVVGLPGEHALEYQVDGADYAANQVILAGDEASLLAFSDDTSIELAAGGRMHMSELRTNGATLMLGEGEVSLAVHHEDDTSWQVHAGPWSVHVTGTQFVVEWEPSTEYFRVAVSEGSVRVEGPEGELANLRAGDSLVRERGKAKIEPETLQIADARPLEALPPRDDARPLAEPEPAQVEPAQVEPEPASNDSGAANERPSQRDAQPEQPAATWLDYFDDSDYERAWDSLAAQPGGIHGQAKNARAATLLDLADVARFTKHNADATKLLEQLRSAHAGSSEAAQAAFTLGRLTASSGSQAKAAAYFEQYLDERPAGSLTGDALGRLMDCYEALGDNSKARTTAQTYLAGHPKGPHADKARSILGL